MYYRLDLMSRSRRRATFYACSNSGCMTEHLLECEWPLGFERLAAMRRSKIATSRDRRAWGWPGQADALLAKCRVWLRRGVSKQVKYKKTFWRLYQTFLRSVISPQMSLATRSSLERGGTVTHPGKLTFALCTVGIVTQKVVLMR